MPAHFCGVLGLKPTINRMPAAGLVAGSIDLPRLDRTLGVCGPMARSIEDLGLALRLLAGPHPSDPEVPPVPVSTVAALAPPELEVALSPTIPGIPVSADVRRAIERVSADLLAAGARVTEQPLPFDFEELLACFRRMIRFPLAVLVAHGHAPPGATRLVTDPPGAAELFAALAERDQMIQRFEGWLAGCDAWICPAAPTAAFPHRPLGQPIQVDGESVSSQVIDPFCTLATYTGCPALVVPIGRDPVGLPIGAQLIGRRWRDEHLLAVGQVVIDVAGGAPFAPDL